MKMKLAFEENWYLCEETIDTSHGKYQFETGYDDYVYQLEIYRQGDMVDNQTKFPLNLHLIFLTKENINADNEN